MTIKEIIEPNINYKRFLTDTYMIGWYNWIEYLTEDDYKTVIDDMYLNIDFPLSEYHKITESIILQIKTLIRKQQIQDILK